MNSLFEYILKFDQKFNNFYSKYYNKYTIGKQETLLYKEESKKNENCAFALKRLVMETVLQS